MFDSKSFKSQTEEGQILKETSFPIHSMKSDQEKIKRNPSYNPGSFSEEQSRKEETALQSEFSEKQKNSPFLSEKPAVPNEAPESPAKNFPQGISDAPVPKSASQVWPRSTAIEEKIPEPTLSQAEKSSSKMNWLILPAILVLIGTGFGIYYYLNRQQNQISDILNDEVAPIVAEAEIPKEDSEKTIVEKDSAETVSSEESELFEDKPNFMVLDEGKELDFLNIYVSRVKQKPSGTTIEFVPTDKKYVPLKLSEFSEKIYLTIPKSVMDTIDNESLFSLFASNESGDVRLGLVISLKKEPNPEPALSEWEKTLPGDLRKLYINSEPENDSRPFSQGIRDGIKTHYKNLTPTGDLSLDYAVLKNKLLIATSKNLSWNLIDKLNQ